MVRLQGRDELDRVCCSEETIAGKKTHLELIWGDLGIWCESLGTHLGLLFSQSDAHSFDVA